MSTASNKTAAKKSNTTWLVGGILAFVALAAVVAIVASGGKDSKKVATGGASSSVAGANTAGTGSADGEQQPVTVTGAALPPDNSGSGAPDPAVGKVPPTLSGKDPDGKPITITPGKDGKLMIVFVAHWCPHCQREVPLLVKWIADQQPPKDLRIVAVTTGTTRAQPNYPPSGWLRTVKWPKEVLADSTKYEAAASWGLSGYPYFVLVNSDGTVAYRNSGEVDPADITKAIADHLK